MCIRDRRRELRTQPLSLHRFLQSFYEDNRPDIELSGQSFLLELPAEPLTAAVDPERLRAALENLCYNALSFTPEDGSIDVYKRQTRPVRRLQPSLHKLSA